MEKKNLEALKMEENCLMGQDHPHPSLPLFSAFRSSLYNKSYSLLQPSQPELPPAPVSPSAALGFMELLGYQGFENLISPGVAPLNLKGASCVSTATTTANNGSSGLLEASEVLNPLPATPNSGSSSISSASNDERAADDNPVKEEERDLDQKDQEQEQDLQNRTRKHECFRLKPKKTNKKKQKEPRIAFMTKSEVDHLEDGYRWRKYGQKAVKNSPFPRSYYRCTTATCNVKKRIERCFNDPSIVVTTYEGQHTHPSPVMAHGEGGGGSGGSGFPTGFLPHPGFSGGETTGPAQFHSLQTQMAAGATTFSSYLHENYVNGCFPTSTTTSSFVQGRRFCNPSGGAGLLRDNGLLQDIVPSHMMVIEE